MKAHPPFIRFPWTDCCLFALALWSAGLLGLLPVNVWLSPEVRPLTQGLSCAWLAWCMVCIERALARRRAWRESSPWSLSSVALLQQSAEGLPLGNAFRWHGGHTQTLELALQTEGPLPMATDSRGGHPALHAVGQSADHWLHIHWREAVGHTGILGTTRSGKTTLLRVMSTAAIHARGATLHIDPKGQRDWLAHCATEAAKAGKRFVLITPAFPQYSAQINVLDTARTATEIVARMQALMPSAGGHSKDPFFEQMALGVIERVAAAQQAIGQPWTLTGLYRDTVFARERTALLQRYLDTLTGLPSKNIGQAIAQYRKQGLDDLTADGLINDHEHDKTHFQSVTGNLDPAFRGLVRAPFGPLFSPLQTDITWRHIVEQEMVVYVALASMLIGDIANRIGRVILQDFLGFLGARYAYHDLTAPTPITVFIDECGDVAYPLLVNGLNKGGGAEARFVLAMQSHADLDVSIGQDQAQRVRDNLNTQLWFRLVGDETVQQVSESLGTCTVRVPRTPVSHGYGGVSGLHGSATHDYAERQAPLVRPEWLKALPRGEAFGRMAGQLFKLRVPLLDPVLTQTIEQVGLLDVWYGLDPATQRRLHVPNASPPRLFNPSPDQLLCDGDEGGPGPTDDLAEGPNDMP